MRHSELITPQRRLRLQCSPKSILVIAASAAWLCGAVMIARHVDAGRPSGGTWVAAAAAIVAVYLWRFLIASTNESALRKTLVFMALLLALTPYIYLFAGLIADWARLPISKWVGDPVWVYAVPIASFALFDFRKQPVPIKSYLFRSGVELFVVVPAWTFAWIMAQAAFGWWYM